MQIMAFGDIHEYLHPLASLAEPLQQADVVLVTGDMTRWRGPETATKVLQAIMSYNLRCGKVDIESLECLKPTRPCPMLSSSIKEVGDGEHQVVGTSW